MNILIFDCFSGISGDMTLGAFIDAGLPLDYLKKRLDLLNLDNWEISTSRKKKSGIYGTYVSVKDLTLDSHSHDQDHNHENEHKHEHEHEHNNDHENNHGHHKHVHSHDRNWNDIRSLISDSGLDDDEKALSIAIFLRIAKAESEAHGVEIDKVHFHEVGAIDSIIDVIGASIGFIYLKREHNIEAVFSTGTNVGGGTVFCAHGEMPVPAPATSLILQNSPIWSKGDFEMTTPTGAAILAQLVSEFSLPDVYTIQQSGLGCGLKEASLPNMLRVLIGETSSSNLQNTEFIQIETLIDDMSGELLSHAQSQLKKAGALEVLLLNANNKGRESHLLMVLIKGDDFGLISDLIFRETTTIGIRYYEVGRRELNRNSVKRDGLNVKHSLDDKKNIANIKPEFVELIEEASSRGITVKELMQDPKFLGVIYE